MSSLRDGKVPFTEAGISAYIDRMARNVVQYMIEKNLTVSTAESCTGGLLSAAITSVPGASNVFECGIASYSERIKEELLGVPKNIIESFGVVSSQTACAMADAVKELSGSDISVAENLRLYELGSFDRSLNRLLTAAFALEALCERLGVAGN